MPGTSNDKGLISARLLILTCTLCVIISIGHFTKRGEPLITTWDVYGYWTYLPAAITYGDVTQFAFAEEHFENYEIASQLFQLTETSNGRVPVYTNGLALLWAPAYLCADVIARLGNTERDGISRPYQYALIFTCLLWGFLGLFVLRKFLLQYFPDLWVGVGLVTLVFGSNFYHYFCHSPGMPHVYLFTCHALILYLSDRWVRKQRLIDLMLGAAIMSISCLIRPTEVLLAIVPLSYVLIHRDKIKWSHTLLIQLLAALVLAIIILMPQLLLWKANTGQWLFNAYADAGHEFHFDGRYLYDGLFSYRKGWLLYTPLMLFAALGLFFLHGEAARWRIPVLMITLAYVFVTFSWHWWWYANSFGARAMIHIYPELTIGLVGLLASLSRMHRALRLVLLGLIILTIPLNVFQTWQFNHKILPGDAINQYYFWRVFGRTEVPRTELKYLFIPHLNGREACEAESLGSIEIDRPLDISEDRRTKFVDKDGRGAQLMTAKDQYSDAVAFTMSEALAERLSGNWIELSAELLITGNDFNSMRNAVYSIEVRRGTEVLMWQPLNFQVFLPQDEWVKDTWEYQLPDQLRAGDEFKYFIWNRNSPDSIYIHSLGVGYLDCED